MTRRTSQWALWLTSVIVVPVPFFLIESGWVPTARLLQLGGVCFALMITEGTQGAVPPVTALLLAQAGFYIVALWLVSTLLVRAVSKRAPRALAATTAVLVAGGLLAGATLEIYRTPFRSQSLSTTLLHAFE